MATVKEINHDSSTTIGDHYSTVVDAATVLEVNGTAALNGSTYGVDVDFDVPVGPGDDVQLVEAFTLTGDDLRFRFRLDLSNLSTTQDESNSIFLAFIRNTDEDRLFTVRLHSDGVGNFEIDLTGLGDSGGFIVVADVAVSGEFCIDVAIVRESNGTAADGSAELFVNDISQGSIANIDNFNIWNVGIGDLEIGINVVPGTGNTSGHLYYDEFILDDDSTISLCAAPFSGYDLVLGGGQP